MRVYFKDASTNKLAKIETGPVFDHEDAILAVKEDLVASGEGFKEPVLVVIDGGKK